MLALSFQPAFACHHLFENCLKLEALIIVILQLLLILLWGHITDFTKIMNEMCLIIKAALLGNGSQSKLLFLQKTDSLIDALYFLYGFHTAAKALLYQTLQMPAAVAEAVHYIGDTRLSGKSLHKSCHCIILFVHHGEKNGIELLKKGRFPFCLVIGFHNQCMTSVIHLLQLDAHITIRILVCQE